MQMTGNTILITGGGSGIGRALAESFSKLGNEIIIAGRRKEVLDKVVEANPQFTSYVVDLQDQNEFKRFVDAIKVNHPSLNVLINNAGIMQLEQIDNGGDISVAEKTIETNLLAPIRLTAALLPLLKKQNKAVVMNNTSGLAFVPLSATPTYCATKAAIHSYTQSLRYQLTDTQVEVLELVPPYVQTELTGSHQVVDPSAMPLSDYIAEVMQILQGNSGVTEICVERVKALRFAEANGNYEQFYQQFNKQLLDARASAPAVH